MEWISVKDRLPEDESWVLAWIGHRFIIDYCGTLVFGECRRFGWDTVTHWMPLPDPPVDPDECNCIKCELKRKGLWKA